MEVGDGQEFRLPLGKPPFGVGAVTLGATGILAGVIGIVEVAAVVIALFQMPPHFLRAAGRDGSKRPLVVVGHPVAELLQILRTMHSDDFRQLDHDWRLAIIPLRLT